MVRTAFFFFAFVPQWPVKNNCLAPWGAVNMAAKSL